MPTFRLLQGCKVRKTLTPSWPYRSFNELGDRATGVFDLWNARREPPTSGREDVMGASGRSVTGRANVSSRRIVTTYARLNPTTSAHFIGEVHGLFGRASDLRRFEAQEALNSIDGQIGHWGG